MILYKFFDNLENPKVGLTLLFIFLTRLQSIHSLRDFNDLFSPLLDLFISLFTEDDGTAFSGNDLVKEIVKKTYSRYYTTPCLS